MRVCVCVCVCVCVSVCVCLCAVFYVPFPYFYLSGKIKGQRQSQFTRLWTQAQTQKLHTFAVTAFNSSTRTRMLPQVYFFLSTVGLFLHVLASPTDIFDAIENPCRLAFSIVIPVIIAIRGLKKKSLGDVYRWNRIPLDGCSHS